MSERQAVQFIPVRGLDAKINNKTLTPITDGYVYFATDSGKIYVDSQGERVIMGAAGAAIYYGTLEKPTESGGYFEFALNDVSGTPKVGDLILNKDGGFYKVVLVTVTGYTCEQVSVSGTGGGIIIRSQKPSIRLTAPITSFINGQKATVHVEAASALNPDGTPIDTDIYVWYELLDASGSSYYKPTKGIHYDTTKEGFEPGKIDVDIEIHENLYHSRTSIVRVWVQCPNHEDGYRESNKPEVTVVNSELKLSKISGWVPGTHYPTGGFDIACTIEGTAEKIIEFYYDDMNTPKEVQYNSDAEANISFYVGSEDATHGYHTVEIRLYQNLGSKANPVKGYGTTPIHYEIPVVDSSDSSAKPIIWLGDYQETYYNYDSIRIPFLVHNPANTSKAVIYLYKNNVFMSEREIVASTSKNKAGYYEWEIVNADLDRANNYQIVCGEYDLETGEGSGVYRNIKFKVVQDPIRTDFRPEPNNLLLNFTAAGRSNDESPAKRRQWSYELKNNQKDPDGSGVIKNAIFENFTWTDKNGWTTDTEIGQTRLTISNGAKFTIPFKVMEFAKSEAGKESHTIEMQFRVRNIQKYGNLINNVTRYKYDNVPDDAWYTEFLNQTKYDNYDAFLQWYLPTIGKDYDKLEFRYVQKDISINNVVGGLYTYNAESKTAVGFCLGPEDAFFSNGQDTVNVNFVEDELINLSFVYQHGLKLMYIYINGVITGVIRSFDGAEGSADDFTINNSNFVFDSKYCDIDLYKLRVYNTNLNVNQIVLNYAADCKDIETYDQSKIYKFASENQALQEYQINFGAIEEYNSLNMDNPTMPYIIFDTGADSLPFSKEKAKTIKVEFINAPLDAAYKNDYNRLVQLATEDGLIAGEDPSAEDIEAGVRTYYMHHCPSWISTVKDGDLVNFEVQGTSSEFYPRRNYKVKTKMDGKFNWVDIEDIDEEDLAELEEAERAKVVEEGGMFTEEEALNIFMHKGPFADDFKADQAAAAKDTEGKLNGYESTRMVDGWYMNNYTNPTDRWTMKVDYMESSGSYNAGFASLVGNAYTKHPLQDYIDKSLLTNTGELKPVISSAKYNNINWEDYRTSLLGYPVMAFQKTKSGGKDKYIFLGYYRMLLDKSSTQVLGFKTPKKVTHRMFPDGLDDKGNAKFKRVRDVAECWEFSNNARGFCSYRDPWNRVELSFLSPKGEPNEWTTKGAPVVANSFEYRYHSQDDYIDKLYAFDDQDQTSLDEVAKEFGLEKGSIEASNRYDGAEAFMIPHRNWEKVVKWVWSTNLDAVVSQGTYDYVLVSDVAYESDKYFLIDETGTSATGFVKATGEFQPDKQYYKEEEDKEDATKIVYNPIRLCLPENLYDPQTKSYYYQVAGQNTEDVGDDVYTLATEAFDNTIDYYEFKSFGKEEMDEKLDLLVRPVDLTKDVFSSDTKYYLWKGTEVEINPGHATGAVVEVEAPTEEDFNAGKYYVANPTRYARTTYTHDSKEYRAAKFTNEFALHFDPEYVATYFVMTEVMELYDSRGKNCMMASWGPLDYQKDANGEYILDAEGNKIPADYIWYPIFYDIDTQLGINNTGIPSFKYNVDATDAGNFSTSDSILWNNFYKFFKTIWMVPKYRNLRGDSSKFADLIDKVTTLSKAPLQSVDYIEKWYTFDPDTFHSIACEGVRPKLATNLDMYFKYITICNEKAKQEGVAHLGGQGSGGAYADPDSGTYFYALQGDRAQSRRQFVESRLDYIDSWLGQGNYARAGQNRLWGRISANNRSDKDSGKEDVHSDKWTESASKPYWKDGIEFGEKMHEFDAEYWLEPTPIRSSYFTAGDDSANYPSKKYNGVTPLKFKLNELENGIRKSDNYPEQLLYIYGTDKMSDFGDLSKMYWTEFKIEGRADKLTRLKLGHDALTYDYPNDNATEKANIGWYNKKLNNITLPTAGLPLLKEANFCNITLTANKPLDLSKSDKLENFRATGSSGITGITFAKGVALNTLYLPQNIGTLSLDGAQLLTKLIGYTDKSGNVVEADKYTTPVNNNGTLVAKQGLYLEGFFDGESSLRNVYLRQDALGYKSFRILKRLYDKYRGTNGDVKIAMTDVNWCPYTKLLEGDLYDASKTYYIDNGHYGFAEYTNVGNSYSEKQFNIDILSGKLYCDNRENSEFDDDVLFIDKNTIDMLKNLYENSNFSGADTTHPEITGIIYIHNIGGQIEETEVSNTLQKYYPNLTFFFADVDPAYSATFVLIDKDTGAESWVKHASDTGYGPTVQKIKKSNMASTYFGNPYRLYKVERDHWDFFGWATTTTGKNADGSSSIIIGEITDGMSDTDKLAAHDAAWAASKATVFKEAQVDYPFYAILTEHPYKAEFFDTFDATYYQYSTTNYSDKGSFMNANVPAPANHSAASLYMRNTFKGWTDDEEKAKKIYPTNTPDADLPLVNVSECPATRNYKFYAVYREESVFNQVVSTEYFNFNEVMGGYVDTKDTSYSVTVGCSISIKEKYKNQGYLNGKITLPAKAPDGRPVIALGSMSDNGITHIFFEQNPDAPVEVRYLVSSACANSANLTYIDFANMPKLRSIMDSAVSGCPNYNGWTFYDPLYSISELAFAGSGGNVPQRANLVLNPMLQNLGRRSFGQTTPLADVTFGTPTQASQLNPIDWIYNGASITNGYAIGHNSGYNINGTVTIYCKTEQKGQWDQWLNLAEPKNNSPLIVLDETTPPTYVFV